MSLNTSHHRGLVLTALVCALFTLVLALVVLVGGAHGVGNHVVSDGGASESYRAEVERVIDGDTLVVRDDGASDSYKVRLIGVDTPELDEEAGAKEARDFTSQILDGKTVWLVVDTEHPTDRYGRTLAYVWITEPPKDVSKATDEEILTNTLNGLLVVLGHAEAMTIEPHTTYAAIFEQAERGYREGMEN